MKITILTYGTFCDIKLTMIIAKELLKKNHKITFITNSIPNDLKINNSNINYLVNDANKFINLNDPKLTEKGESFTDVISFIPLITYINTKFKITYTRYFNEADYVLVHYPALLFNSVLDISKIKKLGIFYVAPAYPNLEIPYIFSKEMLNYNPGVTKNYETSIDLIIKMSITSGQHSRIYNILKFADIFTMWDPLIKIPPKTVKKVIQLSNIVDTSINFPGSSLQDLINALNTKTKKITNNLDVALSNFTRNKNLVYVSFGSFIDRVKEIKNVVITLLNLNYVVIFHGKTPDEFSDLKNNEWLFLYDKFIPHEYIVPKCYMLATSGSYCMTSIANYYGVLLLHIPLLREQLFWAKCYAYNTGTQFINLLEQNSYSFKEINEVVDSITKINNLKIKIYTTRLAFNIKNTNAVQKLISKITS